MHSLKRPAPTESRYSPAKRARMSITSTPEPRLPLHAPPAAAPADGTGFFARVVAGVQDFAIDFWTAFSAPPTTQQKFDFGNPVPPRSGLSSPTPRFQLTNGSSPRRALSQTSSVMSVPSTSASQLDSSLALHDQHMRFTRRLSEVSSNGVHKPRPTRHQHIFAAQHKRQVHENIQKEIYALKRQHGYSQDFATFKGWTWYQAVLLQQEAQGVATKNLDSEIMVKGPANEFIEKALRKARETLKAPRPPLPFHPSYDQLLLQDRRRDSEIDDRIRPKKRPLPSKLPPAAEKEVDVLFARSGPISKCAREAVQSSDIARLRPGQWLNDEIINFYGAMILERANAKENHNPKTNGALNGKGKKPMKVHYFSTFFWPKLNEGYEKSKLNRWTKKIDIFSKDAILIPINHGNSHWTAAAINFRRKRIESYDSMGMKRANVLALLRRYLELEHQDKRKKPFDFGGWSDYVPDDTPQQENCYDCGVFTCQFLETLSRGEEEFAFQQKDMPYLRRKMVWEIGRATLEAPS